MQVVSAFGPFGDDDPFAAQLLAARDDVVHLLGARLDVRDPAGDDGGQRSWQLDSRRQVGQQRDPRPRVGRPALHQRIPGRTDQFTGLDDRQVRRRADGQRADPPVGATGRSVTAWGYTRTTR